MPSGAVGPRVWRGLAAKRLPDCSLITPIGLADTQGFIAKESRPKRSDAESRCPAFARRNPKIPSFCPAANTQCGSFGGGRRGDC